MMCSVILSKGKGRVIPSECVMATLSECVRLYFQNMLDYTFRMRFGHPFRMRLVILSDACVGHNLRMCVGLKLS